MPRVLLVGRAAHLPLPLRARPRAVREDEILAASYGKSVFRSQLWIVLIGSFIAGGAGGLLIHFATDGHDDVPWRVALAAFVFWAPLYYGMRISESAWRMRIWVNSWI